jgi:hypothetical protein
MAHDVIGTSPAPTSQSINKYGKELINMALREEDAPILTIPWVNESFTVASNIMK